MSDTIKPAEFDPDVFDQMVNGDFEENLATDDDQEDTDQEEELDTEEELDVDGDGDPDEDLEEDSEDEEEDSLVDDDSSDDESGDTEDEEEDEEDSTDDEDDTEDDTEDEGTKDESEDDTDTEDDSDGDDSKTTDEVDYKAFYDAVVNTEFVVNGKPTKGFSDPKKIIQSQQMAGGFSDKMAGFKQYRPFMSPLKERGMLEDQGKFDLAMNLIDGDKEAIKQHLKSLDLDPLEFDMEEIKYEGKKATTPAEALILEDVMERAKASGIEEQVRQVIGKDWDVDSFNEFVDNSAVRNDLLQHIENGAYDVVQDKIAEMSRLDYSGEFGSLNSVAKYRAAAGQLAQEHKTAPVVKEQPKKAPKPASVTSEKKKIIDARKQEAIRLKLLSVKLS